MTTDKNWIPQVGGHYYYIDSQGNKHTDVWMGEPCDFARKNFLGIFKIEADLDERRNEVLKFLKKPKTIRQEKKRFLSFLGL